MKEVIDRGKGIKTLSEVKPVENMSENLQSFLEISPMQKEVLPAHKLEDYIYIYYIYIYILYIYIYTYIYMNTRILLD